MRNARNLRWGRKPGEGSGHPRLRWLYRRPLKRRGPMWASAPTKTSYQLPRAAATPRSGALGAAFEEASVAVTAIRFYWPARSSDGVPGDDAHRADWPEQLPCCHPPGMHAAQPHGDRGPQPPARFGDPHRAEKSPAGGLEKARDMQGAPRLMRPLTRHAPRVGEHLPGHLSVALRAPPPLKGRAWAGAVGENVQAAQACV